MAQQQQGRSGGTTTIYTIAKQTLAITTWVWTALVIAFLIQIMPSWLLTEYPGNNWTTMINWLLNNHLAFPWNFLRLLVIIVSLFFIIVTFLAWVIKNRMQEANPEGFDKLIQILEKDTIVPQLELLRQQFEQQLQKQENSIQALGWVYGLLQTTLTSSPQLELLRQRLEQQLQKQDASLQVLGQISSLLQTSLTSSPQLELLQKRLEQQLQVQNVSIQVLGQISSSIKQNSLSSDLQGLSTLSQQQLSLQKEFSRTLQDMQVRTLEQVQWLGDLYEQDQHGQKAISVDLQNISNLLEKVLESLQTPSLSDQQTVTQPISAGVSRSQTDQIAPSFSEYTENYNNNSMNA